MNNEDLQQLKALAMAATPGPWYVQFGDDIRHQCMTAISAVNKRDGNDGLFEDDQPLIAVTFHQSYPAVNIEGDDCGDKDSAYIAAASPNVVLALIARIESLAADAERYQYLRKGDEGIEFRDGDGMWRCDCPRGDTLDKIIDAAIAKEKA